MRTYAVPPHVAATLAVAKIKRQRQGNQDAARLHWSDWLSQHFAPYITAPMAPRHLRLWEWFESLTPGSRPRPRIECWPRGGGKSSSVELACTRVGTTLSRRFVLYVSETQQQANRHVQAIASMLERLGIGRALNEYGAAKGWRHEEIRTATGFNVTAFGLDAGMRGVKLDEVRPDLIVFDDIDSIHDTEATRRKKVETITNTILPTGSTDCAVIVVQNRVYPDSIVSQLADGRADFLRDRELTTDEPAVEGLAYERITTEHGARYVITAGRPTWDGQDLATCEQQMNTWGLAAFLAEAQHQMAAIVGAMFQRDWFPLIPRPAVLGFPRLRYWDIAGTEPQAGTDPDYTAGGLGMRSEPFIDIVDISFTRAAPPGVERLVSETAKSDGKATPQMIEQEPGSQSIHFLHYYRTVVLDGFTVMVDKVSANKQQRASPLAMLAGKGLVRLCQGPWNELLLRQLVAFPAGAHDDFVDVCSGLVNALSQRPPFAPAVGQPRPPLPPGVR